MSGNTSSEHSSSQLPVFISGNLNASAITIIADLLSLARVNIRTFPITSLSEVSRPDIMDTGMILNSVSTKKAPAAVLNASDVPYPLPVDLTIISIIQLSSEIKNRVNRHADDQIVLIGHIENIGFNKNLKQITGDIRTAYGKVWLVGFGPGDPELLTIKALKLLKSCDIIFHDDLLDKEFINQFDAEKVYVGKRKNNHSYEQEDINSSLLNAAKTGKNVVRLKGGDPMLFAHGGEEIEFLQRHFIDTEVVPGITSALAASALSKLPLTHRGISSSVTFITGHALKQIHLPTTGTLVFYMSASNLNNIASQTIKKGWKADTPVLLAYNISGADQKISYTTLGEIQEQPKLYKTPLIIVIGNVVRLKNNPSENIMKPTFLITGTSAEKFNRYGDVIHTPLIELLCIRNFEPVEPTIQNLKTYQWIIFTSRHAVIFFTQVLTNFHLDMRALAGIKIASIGQITTAELNHTGISPDIQSIEESSAGLVKLFGQRAEKNENILIPCSDLAMTTLPTGLSKAGYHVTPLTVYTNKMPSNSIPVSLSKVNYIVFSSPSCVVNFFKIYASVNNQVMFIVQGKETENKLREYPVDQENIRDRNFLNTLPTY